MNWFLVYMRTLKYVFNVKSLAQDPNTYSELLSPVFRFKCSW